MISASQVNQIEEIYRSYSATVKPLIAAIEAGYERFPIQIFNEIRALFDHIARCYDPQKPHGEIDKEIGRCNSHLYRIIFDCFKFLNVKAKDDLELFERQTRNVDLTSVSDGEFYQLYKLLSTNAFKYAKEAKKLESINKDESLRNFENAYNAFSQLHQHINVHRVHINRAKWKFRTYNVMKVLLWLFAAIISGFISLIFTCPQIRDYIISLMQGCS